jgi:phosphate:Na+ symporter
VPAVAIVAVHNSLFEILKGSAQMTLARIGSGTDGKDFEMLEEELARARQFLLSIVSDPSQKDVHQQHVDTLHAMDHIDRLVNIIVKPSFYAQARGLDENDPFRVAIAEALQIVFDATEPTSTAVAGLMELSQGAARQRAQMRDHILDSASHRGTPEPTELTERLRFIVRSDRVLYHLWRASQHLSGTEDVSLHTADDET